MNRNKIWLASILFINAVSVQAKQDKQVAVAPATSAMDRICGEPKSKLYETDDMNKPVRMKMIVDYENLNIKNSDDIHKGIIAVEDKAGEIDFMPVFLTQRGNSRRSYCEAPPLRMEFVDQAIEKKIEAQLLNEKLAVKSIDYFKRYLELFQLETVDHETQVVGPTEGIFSKMGDDIKIVTHCGASNWEHVGGKDEAAQSEKLYSEFYIYQLLATLNTPVERARLANISYFKADGSAAYPVESEPGKIINQPKLAFFREPPKSVAKRCGLISKQTKVAAVIGDDNSSVFQANYLNYLVVNADYGIYGHNMNAFFDQQGRKVYGPYDFDLSGIFDPTYFKNQATLEASLQMFKSWIASENQTYTVPSINRTISAKKSIQDVLDHAILSKERKALFQTWLDQTMEALANYLKNIQPQENNAPDAAVVQAPKN